MIYLPEQQQVFGFSMTLLTQGLPVIRMTSVLQLAFYQSLRAANMKNDIIIDQRPKLVFILTSLFQFSVQSNLMLGNSEIILHEVHSIEDNGSISIHVAGLFMHSRHFCSYLVLI